MKIKILIFFLAKLLLNLFLRSLNILVICVTPINVKVQIYNPDTYLDLTNVGDIFRLLANCFLLFWDLAVLIFATLLAYIQRPNRKSAQGQRGGYIELFNPFPLYIFTSSPPFSVTPSTTTKKLSLYVTGL